MPGFRAARLLVVLVLLAAAAPARGGAAATPVEPPEEAKELLERAQQLDQAGRYDAADQQYEKILREAPGSPEAEAASRRLEPNALLRIRDLEINGPSERRIDIFIMAEGYKRDAKYQKVFDQAAEGTLGYFAQAPVFRRYRKYLNFRAMNIAAKEDGVDRRGEDFDTPLGAFESGATQGQVAVDHDRVMSFLARDPRAEGLAVVIVRLGTLGTGGGGVAVVGGAPSNTVIHEWGHAFGNLLDEYTSDVGYTGRTPVGFNVSDSDDPEKAPWRHWIEAREQGVGVFPGAAGRSQGAWRATASGCAMNRGPSFCVVCREAIVAHVYERVSPLDEATANDDVLLVEADRPVVVQVVPMETASAPALKVQFTLEAVQESFEPAARAAASGGSGAPAAPGAEAAPGALLFPEGGDVFAAAGGFRRHASRFGKAPDPPLPGTDLRADKTRLADKRTAYETTLRRAELDPGSYLLRARVEDPTDWVLRADWKPLLTEARTWRVRVR